MAPSRGLLCLRHLNTSSLRYGGMATGRRVISSFAQALANPSAKLQSYVSRSRDPFVNLSIEDYILRHSPSDSVVLFLYTNRPCVVIGRNQNPWLEVNLGILKVAPGDSSSFSNPEPPAIGDVDLVRRRSGGGAVFHDEGNVNWSITCPRAHFTRDKHAEMTVRALRRLGIERARVNERHDIVLDQGHERHDSDPSDTHATAYTVGEGAQPRTLKVSGSAYKLTRGRALHHATTLLASPNLHIIPQYLHAPAKKFIEAKGVESVSSPVGNIGLENAAFQERIQEEFATMYGAGSTPPVVRTVGEAELDIPEIRNGYEELRTKDWLLSQTPQFRLNVNGSDPAGYSHELNVLIDMNIHHGVIKSVDYSDHVYGADYEAKVRSLLVGRKLQDIGDWHEFLRGHEGTDALAENLSRWLPIPDTPAP